MNSKRIKRLQRHRRVRVKAKGTSERLRLSVFRSNRHIFVQLIDDEAGKTVAHASDIQPKKSKKKKMTPKERASSVGELIAKIAKEKKITRVVFDRGGYTYHGLVKEVAEGARRGGLMF